MMLLRQIAQVVFWFFLWCAIPAALLYPVALWAAKHTVISEDALANSYIIGIGLLFLPTGFLVDFLYRRFIRDRTPKSDRGNSKISN